MRYLVATPDGTPHTWVDDSTVVELPEGAVLIPDDLWPKAVDLRVVDAKLLWLPRPSPDHDWVGGAWVLNAARKAASDAAAAAAAAEASRADGIALEVSADPLVERLRNSTVSEIKTWVASSVTDLLTARIMITRLVVVCAWLIRRN